MNFRILAICIAIFVSIFGTSAYAKKEKTQEGRSASVEHRVLGVAGADIEIGKERVSKSTTWTMNFLAPMDLETRKRNLIKSLCKSLRIDLLVDPQFTYSRRILGGGKLTVTGYPAKYVNFHNLTETQIDSVILKSEETESKAVFYNVNVME